jgi:hypothetical protein
MHKMKRVPLLFIVILFFQHSIAQEYGPKRIKPYDVKLIKGKTLLIPEYDEKTGFVKVFVPKEGFKDLKTEKEINTEYKKRWDSAMKLSSFDLVAAYEIKWFDQKKLEKENDKIYMTFNVEADFYNNWYAYLTVFDPKVVTVATAPINGFDFSKINDIKLCMNMLAYSMIKGTSFYGDDAKSLYRDHQYRYKKAVETFADSLRNRVFLIPQFEKDRKNFKKFNDNLNEYLKLNWKISNFNFLLEKEVNKRVSEKRNSDYYIKSVPIYTSNSLMIYNYWLIMTTANDDVIYGYMGQTYLTNGNLKTFQIDVENWLYYFMNKKYRDKYKMVSKIKEKSATTTKQSKPMEMKEKTAPPPEKEQTKIEDKSKKEEKPKKEKAPKDANKPITQDSTKTKDKKSK